METGPKLDLRAGYHQLTIAPNSCYITKFATHKGLHRYKKINFGTCSASEIFQQAIHEQLRDVPNEINISDDIIDYGTTQTEGISPDPAKVAAIHDAPPPTTIKDVRSFLGLATYCSKFMPNFSDLTEPLQY